MNNPTDRDILLEVEIHGMGLSGNENILVPARGQSLLVHVDIYSFFTYLYSTVYPASQHISTESNVHITCCICIITFGSRELVCEIKVSLPERDTVTGVFLATRIVISRRADFMSFLQSANSARAI